MKYLKVIAILGNIAFILWITFNGIDEGFKGTIYQKISYVSLITVLFFNIYLLTRKRLP